MKDFQIKNRTSTVSPERTSARIEELLVKAGANDIRKRYENSELAGIDFVIATEFGLLSFRIPVQVEQAFQVMLKQRRHITFAQRKGLREQAARSAWKLAQEWLEIQLSMVAMKQAELVQVLLPYNVRDNLTLFDAMKQGGYSALLAAPSSPNGHGSDVVDGEFSSVNQN